MEIAELTDLLKQEGSYTLFAPIDDAFRGLSEADINLLKSNPFSILHIKSSFTFVLILQYLQLISHGDLCLLTADINTLRTILLYHFSNGVFINGGLEGGVTNLLKTMQGNNLQVLSVSTPSLFLFNFFILILSHSLDKAWSWV